MAVTISTYTQFAGHARVFWTPISGSIGNWLVVIHAIPTGLLLDMGGDPGSGLGGWPAGSWRLLAQADAGAGLPKIRAWATRFSDSVTRQIRVDSPNGVDNYSALYYLSGIRPGLDINQVFIAGAAASPDAQSSQTVPLYTPDTSGLLIGAWVSGSVLNYTSLGGPTARTELDGTTSTFRAGEQTLSAAGPGSRTAATSAAAAWAATTIAVRPDVGASVTFSQQPIQMRTELALGANPNQDPTMWADLWTDITGDAQPRDGGITITRGRADEASTASPSTMTGLTLDNTTGRYVRLNPNGPYYGLLNKNTPIQQWINAGAGWDLRYRGFVSEFPPRSQGGEVDEHMPIQADGLMRRLGRGKVLNSPLFRAITTTGAAVNGTQGVLSGYWPLETGPTSGLPGGAPLKLTGNFSFADGGPVGSGGAMTTDAAATAFAPVSGMPDLDGWRVCWFLDIPGDFDGSTDYSIMVNWSTPAADTDQWFCYVSAGTNGKIAIDGFELGVNEFAALGNVDLRGRGPVLVIAWALPAVGGPEIQFGVDVIGADFHDSTNTFTLADNIAPITSIGLNGLQSANGNPQPKGTLSHLMVLADPDSTFFMNNPSAVITAADGYAGERATSRIWRIASEEGIPVSIVGDDGLSAEMGPQPIARFLDILKDCEATDGGLLYEGRDARLAYQTRAGRFNANPVLTLDYEAGHVAPPLEPTDDDQRVLNDFTASRDGGGSARVVAQDHVDAVGQYASSDSYNVADDSQLLDQAGWLVHVGTTDDYRYPAITPNINGKPGLITSWVGLDVGQPAAIINPGRDLPPGQIDVIAEGYTETIDTVSWTATVNTSPGKPWQVGELDDPDLGRIDTDGSILAASAGLPAVISGTFEDFEDASLSVTITNGGNQPWARSTAQAHGGSWSLKSGAITDNQTSDAIVTVPGGTLACTFWYRASSEPGFDLLHVLVDAVEQFTASGETGWLRAVVAVGGASTVTFRYTKDGNTAAGDDAAYIDDLLFFAPEKITVATTAGPIWTTGVADLPFDIVAGGERMTVVSVAPSVSDTFGRTVSSAWGSADTGQSWTNTNGSASDYSVSGGLGRHSLTSVAISRFSTIPVAAADFDVTATVATDALATGASQFVYLMGRYTGTGDNYLASVEFTTAQAVVFTIRKRVSGTETGLGGGTVTGLTHAANTRFAVRFQASGSTLRAKIWLASGAEPDGWNVTATDTAITATGSAGCRSLLNTGNTNTLPVTATFDGFTATHPQTLGVIRSVNGVSKTHTAGEDVRLAQPSIQSL